MISIIRSADTATHAKACTYYAVRVVYVGLYELAHVGQAIGLANEHGTNHLLVSIGRLDRLRCEHSACDF